MTHSSFDREPDVTQVGDSDEAVWNERYASAERVWSGETNVALVAEVSHLQPGRALDVGCGEGADVVWLASRGWDVTALDVSHVALQRAAIAAEQSGLRVKWIHAGLVEAKLTSGDFDLVSAQYPALRRTPSHEAERTLIGAVALGGRLIVVHHADVDVEAAKAHGCDPADYVGVADVAELLDQDWQVQLDERRPRTVTSGAGAHHTHDVVLNALRLK